MIDNLQQRPSTIEKWRLSIGSTSILKLVAGSQGKASGGWPELGIMQGWAGEKGWKWEGWGWGVIGVGAGLPTGVLDRPDKLSGSP